MKMAAAVQILPQTRNQIHTFLQADLLSSTFHELFGAEANAKRRLTEKKKFKKKVKTKNKDKKPKVRYVFSKQRDKSPEPLEIQLPNIELSGNPSAFSVFANVRYSVLEHCIKEAAWMFHQVNGVPTSDSEEEESEDIVKDGQLLQIPKIVGMGLNVVFELVRETQKQYPELCVKALKALLDLLQGQLPESMKGEPAEVLDGMFQLMMDLTTGQGLNNISLELSNTLTSLACAALISLVIAWGDTGKYLSAIGVMLMNTNPVCGQTIPVSNILTSLQKSVHAVLHGKAQLPEWLSQGVKVKALAASFKLDSVSRQKISATSPCALASDGCYLYVLNKQGLSKVGSGFGGTIKGHVYSCKENFHNGRGWLAYAGEYLFFHPCNENKRILYIVNPFSLEIEGRVQLQDVSLGSSVLFSDGQNIGQIAATKDDSFVVRTYDPNKSPMTLVSEVPLKLARKCMDAFGMSSFDSDSHRHSINTGFDEEAVTISAGKEFALIRTVSGKVLYSGKSQSLGIKQGGPVAGKWAELSITKSPKIVQVATGHDSQHALLIADDGSVFFVGTPRRGEDGDSSIAKVRRQPKAMKPKKLIRMESKNVIFGACNNGSSAMVTKEGEVFMYGKDTTHCDHASGHVTDLKDVVVTQVSLGKAHTVVLTSKGLVYTFGINNKGQCGREYSPGTTKEGSSNVNMAEEEEEGEHEDVICPPGKHRWRHDQCMVCTVCGECTGYGVNCISSGRFDRNPGLPCGCGAGDSGCAECGACKSCAGESEISDQLNDRGLKDVSNKPDHPVSYDLIAGGRPGVKPLEQIGKRIEKVERVPKSKSKGMKQIKFRGEVDELETDYSKMVSLPPAEILVGDGDIPVTQVSCGQHHTVVLLQNGDVYTFGSNQYGQLGVGDVAVRGVPTKVLLPISAVQVAAGSSHTVILLANGQVYTCGSYQKGALGRVCPEDGGVKDKSHPWYTVPGPVPGIGARYGRRSTWIGASGDQTYMRIDESLINAHTLTSCNIFANQSCIGLIPVNEDSGCTMKCLMISKHDGCCKSFSSADQENLFHHAVCLDPVYDTLWSYSPSKNLINCYMVLLPEARPLYSIDSSFCNILSPEMYIPTRASSYSTRSHCSLHMLACLDTLTTAQQLHLVVYEETKEKRAATKDYTKEDFSIINRFDSHGGGWGYSGHSVEAIRFMSDTDILLGGFGLFGGRGEYFGRIKLFELGFDGADKEEDGTLLAETEEIPFECAARETYAMLFYEPVSLQANIWYVAWARISGPSSDCGSSGQAVVTTEDQVVFKFKSSKKSNNGTDVNAGQIPQLLYRLPSPDRQSIPRKAEHLEPAHILTQDFSRTVSPSCFDALLNLLEWAWSSFHSSAAELDGLKGISRSALVSDLQRFVYICKACLRLIKIYINEVFSDGAVSKKTIPETMKLAEGVGNSRDLLRKILAEEVRPSKVRLSLSNPPTSPEFRQMAEEILSACHDTFTGCFHAFYPTANLKWLCLCDLLVMLEPGMSNMDGYGRLLAAIMEALTHPTIKLTNIMPINCEPETEEILRRQSISIDDNTNSAARLAESHRFPILVDHMTYRTEVEGIGSGHTSFKEVLDRLLLIATVPIRQALNKEPASYPQILVTNTCALLSCLISELAASATGSELDLASTSRPLLVTPNRFTRTIHGAYWNTGNGSPDAVAFSVDRPGILIAGVYVYGGSVVGGQYEYELELLDDQSEGHSDPSQSHTSRWNSIEIVKGSYGPDDCVNDIAEIKFDRPVPIKEGVKYAVLLRNHGPRTLNGDGGLSRVKCPDGTTFTFTSCSLSSNGTNHMRGQLPQIVYYSASQDGEFQQHQSKVLAEMQARKDAIGITNAICRSAIDILHRARGISSEEAKEILGESPMFSSLLPLVLAYIGPVATQDPRGAVQILGLIHDVLPAVVALNSQNVLTSYAGHQDGMLSESDTCGTNQHYCLIESDHPYKPATVANYKVCFPSTVRWMVLEFDVQCGTAQAEDTLQLYIPSRVKENSLCPLTGQEEEEEQQSTSVLWPVLKKFHGNNWPKAAVVLPGNEVTFSLESASDYVKDEKACFFGFKCMVTGYEWSSKPEEAVFHLERELSFLGGMCASALMRKDLTLPAGAEDIDEDLDSVEEGAQLVFNAHSTLLDKGFALSHPPTIMQALEGNLPFSWQSNERSFLKDFVACKPGTSGGRLARWLQPDSYVDPRQCEVIYNKEELKCSWPAILTVLTKDQYGQVVHVPNLKVEVRAIPIDLKETSGDDFKKMRRLSKQDDGDMTFGGHLPPPLDIPYEVTVKDRKDIFHSICMMKVYENYSFEELRYAAPAVPRPSENMLVRSSNDGSYNCNWTPGSVGFYNIYVTVDGFDAGESFKVDVREPPQGVTPPLQAGKKSHQPNKMRRFVGKNSSGLRIRINPSLQSEQIGTIKPDGTISFVDEIHNDDGVWVRLSGESIKEWCGVNGFTEAWCLQYNQHLGKTLLIPIEEPKSILDEIIKETLLRKIPEFVQESRIRKGGPGGYQVVKCGSSGHNIRCRPSKKATPIGMLVLGNQLTATEDTTNHDGTWVKLDTDSISHYCHLTEREAWSLARDRDDIVYLEHEANLSFNESFGRRNPFTFNTFPTNSAKGFDFSMAQYNTLPMFGQKSDGFGRSSSWPARMFSFGPTGFSGNDSTVFGQKPQQYTHERSSSFGASWYGGGGGGGGNSSDQFNGPVLCRADGFLGDTKQTGLSFMATKEHNDYANSRQNSGGGSYKSSGSMGGSKSVKTSEMNGSMPTPGSQKSTKKETPSSSEVNSELQGFSVKELVKALGKIKMDRESSKNRDKLQEKVSTSSKSSSSSSLLSCGPCGINPHRLASIVGCESRFNGNGPTPLPSPPGTPKKVSSRGSSSCHSSGSSRHGSPMRISQKEENSRKEGKEQVVVIKEDLPSAAVPASAFAQRALRGNLPREPSVERAVSESPVSDHSRQLSPVRSRLSPKAIRKDRGRQLRNKRERAASPSPRETTPINRSRSGSATMIFERTREPVKEALSPSVAECLRAVYAAFLWHEGIVHDAMACASFLKFHPNLSKEMSQVDDKKSEKTKVRQPAESSKEIKKEPSKKGDNLNETRVRFFIEHQDSVDSDSDVSRQDSVRLGTLQTDSGKLDQVKIDTVKIDPLKQPKPILGRHKSEGSVNYQEDPLLIHSENGTYEREDAKLPATLYHLVGFWEELASTMLNVISKDMIYPSPALSMKTKKVEKKEKEKTKEKRTKKKRDLKPIVRGNLFGEAAGVLFAGTAGAERETMCELCGVMYPHPVTYHMRRSHPGCGRYAGGKGYNSGGNFCGGWAGNCGEGGFGGSSWYLICDRCRDKYLRERRQAQKDKEKSRKYKKKIFANKQQSNLIPMESHIILKNNAMFLLDLASAAGISLPSHSHKRTPNSLNRLDMFLPSVSEDIGTDLNPFPMAPFQYLTQQGAQASDSAFAEDIFFDTEERVFVRSGSLSLAQKQQRYRPRLPTEPRHSPLARSGSLSQELRPPSNISPPSPQDPLRHTHESKPLPKSAGTSPEAEQDQKTTLFQRSISEVDSCLLDQGDKHFNRVVMRRRNNSGGVSDGGMSLLKNPSAAMSRLISLVDKSKNSRDNGHNEKTLNRPVMAFVVQRHDLDNLQIAMRHALRKAICRVFAMQGLNWLVRTVTQATCIHDLLWFFVSSLSPTYDDDEEEEEEEAEQQVKEKKERKDQEDVPLCDHPLADVAIAGAAVHPLPVTFHTLLQTVADVMMHLPLGTSLQQMAVRCYCLRFTQADHQFLHESHVFSNISRILVKSDDEDTEDNNTENAQSTSMLSLWKDLTASADIRASSRQSMIASLTDCSTETFWESGDEDRNKSKVINVVCTAQCHARLIAAHIDNTRDLANKVSFIQFFCGPSAEEMNKIRQVEIEARHVGWVNCYLPDQKCRYMKLEMKGPDNSLRLRQIKVLGEIEGCDCRINNMKNPLKMQQDNCEAETLKVFRLLTSQVFGRLITDDCTEDKVEEKKVSEVDGGESGTARDNDLKEHMLGILFSRGSKLSHLQKQVCSHIVQAIKKETRRVRDEWEASLLNRSSTSIDGSRSSSDVYCFELLSMVLALSGSSVGRNYLAQQTGLLQDLFSLLHTASPRVQRQVTSVIRRVLPDVHPQALADLLLVPNLPPTDFNIMHSTNKPSVEEEFDSEKPCILDVFLACISKALAVQTKVKSNQFQKGITTVTLAECLAEHTSSRATGPRWWLRGHMTMCQAGNIIALLQDMAKGHLSEAWAMVSKAAIAEALLSLTKLDESLRLPQACMKTPTLWLALASLCVLDQDHVERLSSGEWRSSPDNQRGPPRPTCDNHDDGETPAIILCNMCGNLCADCNRFLHLHRRTRAHQRQVFKEEEEAIKVDLHEGCGRMKLFWLMLLADSKSLKAMVEFREGKVGATPAGSGTCRFCGTSSNNGLLAIGNVCSDAECQEHGRNACTKTLPCGHTCGGIKNEESCLPCLNRCPAPNQQMLKQDADDMCMICFTEALSAAPALQLKCAHVFHLHCTKNVLIRKWVGPRITFGFSLCPICKDTINHPVLKDLLAPIRELYEDVRRKALMRLEYEGLHKAEAITTPGARYFNDPASFAMERYAYYVCYKCGKAYYGGEARCDEQAGAVDDYDPTELVCGACSDVSRAQLCPKHGTDFLEYKCRYCCSVAVFFCFGTTHFCNTCHDDFQRVTNIPKADLPRCPAGPKAQAMEADECPLNVQHPPTGEEFALGCGVCRNAHTF
ncbi:E3 ubiquitin-protein ligase MYCBP2-like [Octopus vulgaris]|uniref:RCR-type E3 ubiquitin transferase n=1 Tax=Octopus vulgaris TaxID=6645 RepID=A0AA36FET3_OCTVU|nr:E3 ubiquitin-protein ligase MYCBP2-like [Octopus vulgaris]